MYRVDRNNFYENEKDATVFTPPEVSNFLYDILSPHIGKRRIVVDPCVGAGSLLMPWKKAGYKTLGIDIKHQGYAGTLVQNYLAMEPNELPSTPGLVIMNPPFNIDRKTKRYIKENYGGRPLLPEIWLRKAVELFGRDVPIALFTPYGFRLNQTATSKRWSKFSDGIYPPITSIVSLPKDVFPGVLFHSEVLIFNLSKVDGHYFLSSHGEQRTTQKK